MATTSSPFTTALLTRAELPTDLNELYELNPAIANLAYRLQSAEGTYLQALKRAADVVDGELRGMELGRSVNALGALQNTGLRVDTAAATLATLQEVFAEQLTVLVAARKAAAQPASA